MNTTLRLALLASLTLGSLSLTACSGGGSGHSASTGGGGGSGGGSGPTNPLPTPSNSFQAAGTNQTYQASTTLLETNYPGDTAAASGITPLTGTSTLKLTTNSDGTVSSEIIHSTTGGPTLNTVLNGAAFGTDSTANASTIAAQQNNIPAPSANSVGALTAVQQDLSYASYGMWTEDNSASTVVSQAYAFGSPTPAGSVPTTGTATYNGTFIGDGSAAAGATNAGGNGTFAVSGTAALTANFNAGTVAATFSNATTATTTTGVTPPTIPTLSGTLPITGNSFAGSIADTNNVYSGSANGGFYGPAAQNVAGVFTASSPNTTIQASFGAK